VARFSDGPSHGRCDHFFNRDRVENCDATGDDDDDVCVCSTAQAPFEVIAATPVAMSVETTSSLSTATLGVISVIAVVAMILIIVVVKRYRLIGVWRAQEDWNVTVTNEEVVEEVPDTTEADLLEWDGGLK